jgi:hypothetical protein
VTLILWMSSALFWGFCIYRVSRNVLLASAAGLATTSLAMVLAYEPGHPQQFILPIFMLACCASVAPRKSSFLLLGLLGGGLIFIKINVALFYFAAVGFAFVCGLPAGRMRKIGAGVLLFYAAAGPLVLMYRDVTTWADQLCLLAILCGFSTFAIGLEVTSPSPERQCGWSYLWIGVAIVTLLVVITSIYQGMSLHSLMDGVILAPLQHPGVFELPFRVGKKYSLLAVAGSCWIVALYLSRGRWQGAVRWTDITRCVAGLWTIGFLVRHQTPTLEFVTLLPIVLMPTGDRCWKLGDFFPRVFITGLAATQLLQIYPVGGSQVSIAAAPSLLWAFLCIHDGLGGVWRVSEPRTEAAVQKAIVGGVLAISLGLFLLRDGVWRGREMMPASRLWGAGSLHLSAEDEDRYEFLAHEVQVNCDMLFTLPGMGSLNFWSGLPTPNGMNETAWMKGFSTSGQQKILNLMRGDPRACAIYNPKLANFWGPPPNELMKLPLAEYVIEDMPKVAATQGYEIHVSPRRSAPWIDTAGGNLP